MPYWTLPPVQPLIHPYAEIRERFERRIDRDFSRARSDNRSDLLSRWRLGATASLGKSWKAEIQYQYAHDLAWTGTRNFSTEASDISLANVQGKVAGFTTTLGRQKINIGDQRLIGSLEWANVPRSFDGFFLRSANVDLWAASIGVAAPRPRNARLAGAAYRSRYGETNLIFKHDSSAAGTVDISTLDHLAKRQVGQASVEFEGAFQGGRNLGKDHTGWTLHAAASLPLPHRVSAYIEMNAASGGSNTGKSLTFDNLYPTNHNKYGIADMQSWRNMNELAFGVNWTPRRELLLHLSYHVFSLRDPRDAWYGATGGVNGGRTGPFRDPTGASGRDTGRELDLDSTWRFDSQTTLQLGGALFQPGNFVRSMNAGDARQQTWFYVQLSRRF